MTENTRKYGFIDALRGHAILGVIAIHCAAAVPPTSPGLLRAMEFGSRGVQLFYIASALTLCMSWDARGSRERSPIRNFFLRRFFRIAPLFYAAIAFYVALHGLAPRKMAPDGIEPWFILATATFLHGWHPETISSVVPGGWSIAVEMTFYLILPVLLSKLGTIRWLVALLAASLALHAIARPIFLWAYAPSYPPDQHYLIEFFVFYHFFTQLPVFALGLLAYAALRDPVLSRRAFWFGIPAYAGLLFGLAVGPSRWAWLLEDHIIVSVGLALMALVLSRHPARLLVNRPVIAIGKLSYSMYLTHFAVLTASHAAGIPTRLGSGDFAALAYFAGVVAVTASVSAVTHRLIERPGIRWGKRIIDRLESRNRIGATRGPSPRPEPA